MGAEISWGSSSLVSAATFLSDSVTLEGSGAMIVAEGRCGGFVEHDIERTHKGTHENRIQTFSR
jgi:hypothetical protein